MELIELKANVRTGRKKGPSRRLRAEGRIPAVLYGPGAETIALSIDTTELDKAIKSKTGSQAFFNMVDRRRRHRQQNRHDQKRPDASGNTSHDPCRLL